SLSVVERSRQRSPDCAYGPSSAKAVEGRARIAGLTRTMPRPYPPVTSSHTAKIARINAARRSASDHVRLTPSRLHSHGTRHGASARSSSRGGRNPASHGGRKHSGGKAGRSHATPSAV